MKICVKIVVLWCNILVSFRSNKYFVILLGLSNSVVELNFVVHTNAHKSEVVFDDRSREDIIIYGTST